MPPYKKKITDEAFGRFLRPVTYFIFYFMFQKKKKKKKFESVFMFWPPWHWNVSVWLDFAKYGFEWEANNRFGRKETKTFDGKYCISLVGSSQANTQQANKQLGQPIGMENWSAGKEMELLRILSRFPFSSGALRTVLSLVWYQIGGFLDQ